MQMRFFLFAWDGGELSWSAAKHTTKFIIPFPQIKLPDEILNTAQNCTTKCTTCCTRKYI